MSTNMIEKITGISSLKNLRILSVGRNYIKNFTGLVIILFWCCCWHALHFYEVQDPVTSFWNFTFHPSGMSIMETDISLYWSYAAQLQLWKP